MNFKINSTKPISEAFLKRNINDFYEASQFIKHLVYRRNSDKHNLFCVFEDHCGTCSTKHSLLKNLADENGETDLKLMLGIFKMNSENTPKIELILDKYHLDYIPEAHNYLKWNKEILDFTSQTWISQNFVPYLLEEIEIKPTDITDFKVNYHRQFLENWLLENPKINYKIDDIWKIREECIAALSQ